MVSAKIFSTVAVFLIACFSCSVAGELEVQPAPPSIGADVPVTYFGPPPSSVDPRLVGPVQLLKSGTIDFTKGTITLPLYRGQTANGRPVWYIVTDASDKGVSEGLGINYSAKLVFSSVGRAARPARLEKNQTLTFLKGTVNFRPKRVLVPGAAPNFFPPKSFSAGSVGDADYSPLAIIQNLGGLVLNAPVIAFGDGESAIDFCSDAAAAKIDYSRVHDKVVRICPKSRTVTLALTQGFSFGKPVLYLSTDANAQLPAAFEAATLAPGLNDIDVGGDDSLFSPVERLFAFVNGPTGKGNPQRQGFNSALSDGHGPLNVLGGIPFVATDYSPLWDLNVGQWTADAIKKGYRARMTEEFAILGLAERGFITGPGGAAYGSSGFIVNCPPVHRFL